MSKIYRKNFGININKLESILGALCGVKYKYRIEKSSTTNSVYVTIYNEYCGKIIRISDHGKCSNIRQCNVNKTKDAQYIVAKIKRMIRRLDSVTIDCALEKINNGGKQ